VAVALTDPNSAPPGLPEHGSGASYSFAVQPEEVRAAMVEADVLFLWDYTSNVIERAWTPTPKVRWIHVAGVGLEAILFPGLADSAVVLTNSRGVFDRAMAETTIGVITMHAKQLDGLLRLQAQHRWEYLETDIVEGKRLLVVGVGSIGRTVARLAAAVGLEVHGLGRRPRPADPDFRSIVGVEELRPALGAADYVVIALPLTEHTRDLFDAAAFAAMKPGAYLVNLGRGAVVDEPALLEALRSGRLGGAALDVFWQEPLDPAHPLWEMPNVIVLSHNSGWYRGWQEVAVAVFLDNLARWQRGEPLRNVVDKRLGFMTGG
jgi:phosphoglycerate dehydrogenase-like enzyme